MSSDQELKHRTRQEEEIQAKPPLEHQKDSAGADMNGRRRAAMATRGLRSLAVAVALPVFFALIDVYLFGSNLHYATMKKPFLYPPLWALHSASLGSAFLMGLSAWLVWADGGFHRFPTALLLYLGQLGLGLAWNPIVLRAGDSRVGLVMCVALIGALAGCIRMFGRVNPIAGDVAKPTLLWALLLALVNLKLVYH